MSVKVSSASHKPVEPPGRYIGVYLERETPSSLGTGQRLLCCMGCALFFGALFSLLTPRTPPRLVKEGPAGWCSSCRRGYRVCWWWARNCWYGCRCRAWFCEETRVMLPLSGAKDIMLSPRRTEQGPSKVMSVLCESSFRELVGRPAARSAANGRCLWARIEKKFRNETSKQHRNKV